MGETKQPDPSHVGEFPNGYPRRLPDSIDDLKAVVTSGRVEFSERLRQIGIYAFRNPHQMAFFSIQEIATVTETSPSSVHRFAKTLGFADYGALRKIFQKHIADTARENNQEKSATS
ncbi:MurR/RpiR family transcriptional regulator [Rhizobium leguminosarum]|uniref:MurR/RpiR family transcriptional regulator n=1 Tax=Rhizobium leguminosarum TaxID=384 RepID=UPI000480374A|nr:MurR/RpiR family transcriptional regulator [Rhizobium leguminosarum]